MSEPTGYVTVPPHVLRTLVSAIAVGRAHRTDRAAGILQRAVDDAGQDEGEAAR